LLEYLARTPADAAIDHKFVHCTLPDANDACAASHGVHNTSAQAHLLFTKSHLTSHADHQLSRSTISHKFIAEIDWPVVVGPINYSNLVRVPFAIELHDVLLRAHNDLEFSILLESLNAQHLRGLLT